jgi:lipoprotein-anchoring transpeptidase ErfK/SrfK
MVLNSQQIRDGANRSYLSSRRRKGRWRLPATLVILALVGVGAWRMIVSGDSVEPANADEAATIGRDEAPAPPPVRTGGQIPATTSADTNLPSDPALTPLPTGPRVNRTTAPSPATSLPAPASTDPRDTLPAQPSEPAHAASPLDSSTRSPSVRSTGSGIAEQIETGRRLIQQGQLVKGRQVLNIALGRTMNASQARLLREELSALNEKLIFSPRVEPNDPYSEWHVVASGELLSQIAPRHDVTWQFLAMINKIPDPRRVRAGARVKIVHGPFHAVVHKDDYRVDVYLDGSDGERMYVRSFRVGLGEYGSTPSGMFVVDTKLENPEWTNPRTGQRFLADDPMNPLGEHWIGLKGVDSETELLSGYGLHGTIDPASIGGEASMGCVRMLPDDVKLLFAMLVPRDSTVQIVR